MTPPRDVQDYEAQAREILAADDWKFHERIPAALRAAERAALERAAQVADEEHAEAWKSSRAADARGDHRVGAADAISAATAQRIAFVIRALIAPAPESPPAKVNACQVDLRTDKDRECFEDVVQAATRILRAEPPAPSTSQAAPTEPQPEPPRWRIGRHYGIHVYRGDTPIATFHTVADAQAAVRAYNASLDRSAPAPDLRALLVEALDIHDDCDHPPGCECPWCAWAWRAAKAIAARRGAAPSKEPPP